MSKTIDTEDYCRAFETWVDLPRGTNQVGEGDAIRAVTAYLREHLPGVHPIKSLCDAFRERIRGDNRLDRYLEIAVAKSCLLHRLIYGGEKLRTKMCPVHKGEWSGWSFEVCKHGCSYGPNLTGWIAE